MTVDTKGFRKAHDDLVAETSDIRLAAESFPSLTDGEREVVRTQLVHYLRERVLPHTELDERLLYPEAARRLGDPLFSVAMSYDHRAIRHWIDEIATADVGDTAHVQGLLYGLDALIRAHIWKEDELFVGALERHTPLPAAG